MLCSGPIAFTAKISSYPKNYLNTLGRLNQNSNKCFTKIAMNFSYIYIQNSSHNQTKVFVSPEMLFNRHQGKSKK